MTWTEFWGTKCACTVKRTYICYNIWNWKRFRLNSPVTNITETIKGSALTQFPTIKDSSHIEFLSLKGQFGKTGIYKGQFSDVIKTATESNSSHLVIVKWVKIPMILFNFYSNVKHLGPMLFKPLSPILYVICSILSLSHLKWGLRINNKSLIWLKIEVGRHAMVFAFWRFWRLFIYSLDCA